MEYNDFHISYQCPNKCLFCSSAECIERFKTYSVKFEKIFAILKKKTIIFKGVNFSGGEPTLAPFFQRLIKETKNLGYKICIGSGGGRFSDKKFCEQAAPFIDAICFSVHGHRAILHNFHTKNKESFKRLVKAIKNFEDLPTRLFTNTVVTKYNIDFLKDILKFIIKFKKIEQAEISNLVPEGRGLRNYDRLVADINILKKKAPALIEFANKNNLILKFFGFPACIFGEYAVYSNGPVLQEGSNIEQTHNKVNFLLQEDKGYYPNQKRIKTDKCQRCFYRNICGGLFEEYYSIFGDKQLEPIKKQHHHLASYPRKAFLV
jgi:MoaA/NifB/PqqE/SkfB family radical SAM enzyme